MCGKKIKPAEGNPTFGNSYFRPIHFWGCLFKTTYVLKYRLGDLYQELCQPCTNAFTKVIKQRKKLAKSKES